MRYVKEATKRHQLLTGEEEQELARQVKIGNKEAERRLVLANLRLVVKIAHEYKRHDNFHDLIQEGNIGLVRAVKKFTPNRSSFSSYASFWIRAYILKYVIDSWSLVKIGTTGDKKKIFYRLNSEREKLEKSGVTASTDNLARSFEVSFAVMEEMEQRMKNRGVSLDAALYEDDTSFLDMTTSDKNNIEEALIKKDLVEVLQKNLSIFKGRCNERERFVIDNRIMSDDPLTLEEVGKCLNITREGARQIQVRMLKNLKKLKI